MKKQQEAEFYPDPPTARMLTLAEDTSRLSGSKIPISAFKNRRFLFDWISDHFDDPCDTWEGLEVEIDAWSERKAFEARAIFLDSLGSDKKILDFLNSLEGEEKIDYLEALTPDDPLREQVELTPIEIRTWKRLTSPGERHYK